MNNTVADVVNKLQTKGSADQIAAFFHTQQVQGDAFESKYCPVAQYITRETGHVVSVGLSHILVLESGRWRGGVGLDIDGPIARFICRFDGGRYPELAR